MSSNPSSRRRSLNTSTSKSTKKRDVTRDTILMKYQDATPKVVLRSDSHAEMVAAARKYLSVTHPEVRNAATANIRLMGQHPAYGEQVVEITDEVWEELHQDLTEFSIAVLNPLRADVIMLDGSDDGKDGFATPPSSSIPVLTVDTQTEDHPSLPQPPAPSSSIPAAAPASRSNKRKASDNDVPSNIAIHEKKQTRISNIPLPSKRKAKIVNNAFVQLPARSTAKGKQRAEPEDPDDGSDESDSTGAMDIDANAAASSSSALNSDEGYHTLASHLKVESEFIDYQRRNILESIPWLAPPAYKHEAIRTYLRDAGAEGLTDAERLWVGRHRLRGAEDNRPILASGEPLRVAMLWAHDGHLGSQRSHTKLRSKYFCPNRDFMKLWVRRCPTCRGRYDSSED